MERVMEVDHSEVAPNGEEIIVRFRLDDGTTKELSFDTSSLGDLTTALISLAVEATPRLHGQPDPSKVYELQRRVAVLPMHDYHVGASIQGLMPLMLRATTGYTLWWGVTPEQAVELASLLTKFAGIQDGSVTPLRTEPR